MAVLIDGKAVSNRVLEEVAGEVAALKEQGIRPCLAVVLAGDDPASKVYIRNKKTACAATGIDSRECFLPGSVSQQELAKVIRELNGDPAVSGILVQLPLPDGLDSSVAIESILPEKDVDCFHPVNVGKLMQGEPRFVPCTPAGIRELLYSIGLNDLSGKRCVVLGRSNIVGKPMAMLLLRQNGTVTVCHSRTAELPQIAREADILVSAVGKAGFVTADMVKPGAVVIDVGMNRDENGKLCGDVDFAAVEPLASAITPVPGGVGPMTVAMLMKNTVTAAKLQNGLGL